MSTDPRKNALRAEGYSQTAPSIRSNVSVGGGRKGAGKKKPACLKGGNTWQGRTKGSLPHLREKVDLRQNPSTEMTWKADVGKTLDAKKIQRSSSKQFT